MRSVGTRFLIPFGLLCIAVSAFVFHQVYESSRRHANELISQQAAVALEFNLAIRDYAARRIRPVMEKLVDHDTFIPETMSTSFISREIFEEVRKKLPQYVIRFSSDNPRNPINLANPDERRMIDFFRQNPGLESRTEEIQINGKRYLAHFTPKWMKTECMRCHGDPQDAPADLVERYGSAASFNRKVGDVAGLDTVAIPVEATNGPFVSELRSQSWILGTGLILLFGSIFIVFKFVVSRRLEEMAAHFNEIAAHKESPWMTPVEVKGNDEISVLGRAFNKLLEQLRTTHASLELRVRERTDELRSANERLHEELAERQRAEEALRLTQFSVEHAAEPIYWMGPDAGIIYANEAACRTLGYSREELLSLSVPDIDPHFSADTWSASWEDLKRKGSLVFESVHRRSDDTTFPAEVHANTMVFGDREFSLVFVKDISERKQAESQRRVLEAQLRQAQKMEAIGTLAGGIAHDFNNILSAIIGYTEMVLAELPEQNGARGDLEQVLKAGYRARDLVRQILVFSRMETRETYQRVDVARVVEEVQRFLRASLPTTIEIRNHIGNRKVATMGDPTQIHELLMNLCTNAAHAMEKDGGLLEVILNHRNFEADEASLPPGMEPGLYVELKVTDTGSGMDVYTMDHIFEPYFTTKEVGKGTGFGLAVVHGIVKRHGGAITVQSEVGKGTTFSVFLPAVPDRAAAQEETCDPLRRGTERILHVDDEEMLTVVVQRMLTQLGYHVTSSTSSLEALELFRQNPEQFDLVITDYTMPHLTGADLAGQLLTIRSDIPIILCTGFSERITEEGARRAGIREFAMKPLNMQSVATIIRRVLDNNGSNPSADVAAEGSSEAIVRMTKEGCSLPGLTSD